MPPRVVIVHSSDELYGADRILLQVVATMRDLGIEPEVWLPDDLPHGPHPLCAHLDREAIRWRHVDLPIMRRARMRPLGLLCLARSAVRTYSMLRRGDRDAVYLSSSASLLVAPIARVAGVPKRLLHVQERWEGRSAAVLRRLASATTARVAISHYVAGTTGLVDPAPIVVENVVDDASRRVTPPPPGRHRSRHFVVASRWNRWKGHATLLDAWERAGCLGTLTVLGGPPSSGEGVDVPGIVAGLARPESVRIVGEVDDIAPFVAAADALVLPSDEPEPFGLVVIEAFSLGRPVIASAAGGPLDVIEDGVTGWFFEPRDAAALAAVFARLGSDDVRRAGEQARRAYEKRFEPSRFRIELGRVLDAELGPARAG